MKYSQHETFVNGAPKQHLVYGGIEFYTSLQVLESMSSAWWAGMTPERRLEALSTGAAALDAAVVPSDDILRFKTAMELFSHAADFARASGRCAVILDLLVAS
jgi:hypothetical protein